MDAKKHLALPPINVLAVLHDSLFAAVSFVAAMYLRLSMQVFNPQLIPYLWQASLGFTLLLLASLLYFRLYRRLWRYTSLNDLLVIAKAGTLALVVFYLVLFSVKGEALLPRSMPLIHWMSLMVCLTAGRVLARVMHDRSLQERFLGRGNPRVPVLLIGATAEAETFIRESTRNAEFPYRVVGLVDDDTRKHGREIHHVRIYVSIHEIAYILRKLERKGRMPQRMVLTDSNLSPEALAPLLEIGEAHHLSLARLPKLTELREGEYAYEMRPIAVGDILGRPQQVLDRMAMAALVEGKRVLITGAGGSIGSELTRQIAGFSPAALLLYELSEYNLYAIDRVLAEAHPALSRVAVVGDVRDSTQLMRVMQHFAPEIVFHAAALKHVPLSEQNVDQAVLTNVLGSKHVADACAACGVHAMVQISTDKAVNPSSVMGATKRIAEIYGQALAQDGAATRYITVRFGNVLNSAGSVVPLFQEQLAAGGPLTVTHPDMTRYFMSISEAVELVLQSAALAMDEPDPAPIFVLEMGQPIKIVALAEQMIRLAGRKPHSEIPIIFTGLRAGEKLYEELFHADEHLRATRHPSIRLATARTIDRLSVLRSIGQLAEAARSGDEVRARQWLKSILPEYHESEAA